MLLGLLGWITRKSGRVKRFLWRSVYERLGRFPDARWTFMNYGFARLDGSDEDRRRPAVEDGEEQLCAQLYDHVASAVPLSERHVLEVASGRGGGAAFLFRHHRPASLTGVDLSSANVRFCTRVHAQPGLSFVRGEAERLPFDAGAFDVVISVEASHAFASVERFLREARRVLRPGGYLLLADLRAREDVPAVRQQVEAAGFRVARLDLITPHVVRALELDSERRSRLIEQQVHPWMRPAARTFAGLPGTLIFNDLQKGSIEYVSLVAQNATDVG